MIRNDVYAVDYNKTTFKFSVELNEWELVYKFDIPNDVTDDE